jgi:hypothetical protein
MEQRRLLRGHAREEDQTDSKPCDMGDILSM